MFFAAFLLTGAALAAEASLPPKHLLHVGEKSVLLGNALAGNIPVDAWDRFIMGEETNWKLPTHRRGLYGGIDLGALEMYGSSVLLKGGSPWLMKITLKDACLTESATTGTYYDPRFTKWVIANSNEILKSAPQCLQAEIFGQTVGCDQMFTGGQHFMATEGDNDCDRLVGRFLKESSARVVKDAAVFDSWYIRDRDCIERIDADPLTVLNAAAEGSWVMRDKVDGTGKPIHGAPFFLMLMEAMAELKAAPDELITRLEAAATASDITPTKDSAYKQNFWLKANVPPVMQAYRRCKDSAAAGAFAEAVGKFKKSLSASGALSAEGFLGAVEAQSGAMTALCR